MDENQFKCTLCPKAYDKEVFLINHVKKVHSSTESSTTDVPPPTESVESVEVATVATEVVAEQVQETHAIVPTAVAAPEVVAVVAAVVEPAVQAQESVPVVPTVVVKPAVTVVEVAVVEPTAVTHVSSTAVTPVVPTAAPTVVVATTTAGVEYEPVEKLNDHKSAMTIGRDILTHFARRDFSMFVMNCSLLFSYSTAHINEILGHIVEIAANDQLNLCIYSRYIKTYIKMLSPSKLTIRSIESYIVCETIVNLMNKAMVEETCGDTENKLSIQYVLVDCLKKSREFELIFGEDPRILEALNGDQLDYFAFKDGEVNSLEQRLKRLACKICKITGTIQL